MRKTITLKVYGYTDPKQHRRRLEQMRDICFPHMAAHGGIVLRKPFASEAVKVSPKPAFTNGKDMWLKKVKR